MPARTCTLTHRKRAPATSHCAHFVRDVITSSVAVVTIVVLLLLVVAIITNGTEGGAGVVGAQQLAVHVTMRLAFCA